MNAIYLHLPDGSPTKWSMCTECRIVAAPGNFDLSQKCCTCYDCGEPLPKDQRTPYAEGKGKALYHRECEQKRRAKRDMEILEKAELVTGYDGPVYFEDYMGRTGIRTSPMCKSFQRHSTSKMATALSSRIAALIVDSASISIPFWRAPARKCTRTARAILTAWTRCIKPSMCSTRRTNQLRRGTRTTNAK